MIKLYIIGLMEFCLIAFIFVKWSPSLLCFKNQYKVNIQICTCPDVRLVDDFEKLKFNTKKLKKGSENISCKEMYLDRDLPNLYQIIQENQTFIVTGDIINLKLGDGNELIPIIKWTLFEKLAIFRIKWFVLIVLLLTTCFTIYKVIKLSIHKNQKKQSLSTKKH